MKGLTRQSPPHRVPRAVRQSTLPTADTPYCPERDNSTGSRGGFLEVFPLGNFFPKTTPSQRFYVTMQPDRPPLVVLRRR